MTIQEAKNKLVAWAAAQVGYAEGNNNWNKYAQNRVADYGWDVQNQPWCDVFVDVGFIECFGSETAAKLTYQPRGGFSALCSASANYYKANGAWFSTPAVGDQVFFNVSGGINHTGIVIGVSGGVVTTVEGNSSDMVRRNSYAVSNSYIAGFGRPNWEIFTENSTPTASTGGNNDPLGWQKDKTNVGTTPANDHASDSQEPNEQETGSKLTTCSVSVKLPVINYGDASVYVKVMQTMLIGRGFNCGWWGADGEYGQQTKIALYQFQQKNGLEADYVCGQATWQKLLGV